MPTATPIATIDYANAYFATRLHSQLWFDSTEADQGIALLESTRAINQLAYMGFKTSRTQDNEFPRWGQTTIPDDIMQACCENALRLLDGVDMEEERKGLNVVDRGYSQVRTRYDTNHVPEYLAAGIASVRAWDLLYPFLSERGAIAIRRV